MPFVAPTYRPPASQPNPPQHSMATTPVLAPTVLPAAPSLPIFVPALMPAGPLSPVRLISNNDPHETFSVYPRMITGFRELSRQASAQGADVLRLNAGDDNIGREPRDWELNVLLMNLQGLHAATLGNHDFDGGVAMLARAMLAARFPWVVGNLKIPANSSLMPMVQLGKVQTQGVVVQGQHGKYGIIGVTTPTVGKYLNSHANAEGVTVEDREHSVQAIQRMAGALESQGVDRIILLSHMGYARDVETAQKVSGVDIIVGGHSHTELEGVRPGKNWFISPRGEPVYITQAGRNSRCIDVTDVGFDPLGRVFPAGGGSQLVSPFLFAEDPAATSLITQWQGPPKTLAFIAPKPDGSLPYDNDNILKGEDPVANFAADALREAADADVALVRSANIRDNLYPGPLTDQHLKEMLPFTDEIVRLPVTGAELLATLQRSAKDLAHEKGHPGVMHPAGLSYVVNGEDGQLVSAAVYDRESAQWRAIQPEKWYMLALDEYGAKNQKEWPEIAHPERIDPTFQSGKSLRDAFASRLAAKGPRFETEGRLMVVNPASQRPEAASAG
jgi:5'-nucleotidase